MATFRQVLAAQFGGSLARCDFEALALVVQKWWRHITYLGVA
jgi:hypothetical protein